MKKLFTKNIAKTEQLKGLFNSINEAGYEYIGVFDYKDYVIIFDKRLKNEEVFKHISVSRHNHKSCEDVALNIIAEHFLGKNYKIIGNAQMIVTVHIWEVKDV